MIDNPAGARGAGEAARTAGGDRPDVPTVREIAALTARLWGLSALGAGAGPAERAAFLADKDALIDRITAVSNRRLGNIADIIEPGRPDDPAEIAARIAALRERITARDTKVGSADVDPGPQVVGLVGPECGEDAIESPPTTPVPH